MFEYFKKQGMSRREVNERNLELISTLSDNSLKRKQALLDVPFFNIVFENGEYCNFNCDICYADLGPNKKNIAPIELFQAVREQIDYTDIHSVIITEGEPTANISRLSNIVNLMQPMPLEISSNIWFADSKEKSREFLERLKDSGFSLEQKKLKSRKAYGKDVFSISVDDFHEGSYYNFINFINSYEDVFRESLDSCSRVKESDYMRCFSDMNIVYSYIDDSNHPNNDVGFKKYKEVILDAMYKGIGGFSISSNKNGSDSVMTKGGLVIDIHKKGVVPEGRAKKIIEYDSFSIDPIMLGANNEESPNLYVRHNGDVYWGGFYKCISKGRKLGNVYEGTLSTMISEIKESPLFQFERIFGVKGLYQVLHDEGIMLEGSSKCDICNEIFNRDDLQEQLVKYVNGRAFKGIKVASKVASLF